MTATIAYDLPMKNLIDELSATGHVTHTAYRKTMVTIHHNGGRLTHEGCLNVWKTRPASAHFDIDASGAACQYVKVNEYAWACASQAGNQTSISIEMADATLSPTWEVSETTWKSAARLAGWLFARVIGARPTAATLVYHHYWYATSCAGPYMDANYARVLAATQAAYDAFMAGTPTTPTGGFLMALTDAQQTDLYNRVMGGIPAGSVIGAKNPDGSPARILTSADGDYLRQQILASKVDPAALASALAPAVAAALPAGGATVTDTQLEAALRKVLGSVDGVTP